MLWDGNTLRIEFCVTRYSPPGSAADTPPERHPACRLVLTAHAATELFNRLQQTMSALTKAGVIVPRMAAESGAGHG
jgi:alpha-beta hydrolase superfamily lysophospholipase